MRCNSRRPLAGILVVLLLTAACSLTSSKSNNASPAATAAGQPTVAAVATASGVPVGSPSTQTSSTTSGPPPVGATGTPAAVTVYSDGNTAPPGTPRPAPVARGQGTTGLGTPAPQQLIQQESIAIPPDGSNLPAGSGTPSQGAQIFSQKCAVCHGDHGQGGTIGPQLVSQPGPYQPGMPKTIGSYWPYATTLWDYIHRAMPFNAPGSLTNDQVYAVVAYLLNQNQVIGSNDEMNAQTLPKVQMPNRDGFIECWPNQCRPDVP